MRKHFIAGNWKMYKTTSEAKAFAKEFKNLYKKSDAEVAVIAPFTQLAELKKEFSGTGIKIGAQNVHYDSEGAFTGEISADMLKEIGVDFVIVGHSERRQYFGETDDTVNLKLKKCIEKDLLPILCVGESLKEREAGKEFNLVDMQLTKAFKDIAKEDAVKITVAYEPIWAIGTGLTASSDDAENMIKFIRDILADIYENLSVNVRIQYGGSVKPDNIKDLMQKENVDGALVGGACLESTSFCELINYNL